ncbi:helicase/secretion neighborhood CpaE-like protein [Amycolatopsis arida]|uniref:Helicase/secretion neighborhood CpaE-like protein n=1 Tax=Amycolatopsis arida TaxID=587909 RepID=A0A1I6AYH2_9PSEU|nr:septum site-determining protein Ssd [Amycolatopsis arida]TDX83901.1 secretion/DNA translocation related CpaE-like protein [Amycolatopsis arida]SFQ73744.1 helicase/secretion neighborhood CpaE-like protein [Amycolatopsis arida]
MAPSRPLVVVHDETLLDEVLRVAAAVGCEPERVPDHVAAGARWTTAPLVVIDEDVLREGDPPPRARGVLLVCKGSLGTPGWQRALRSRVERVVVLPDDEAELVSAFADVLDGPPRAPGRVAAVLGGRGGAGASVFAAAMAVTHCRSGGDSLLVDCDSLGGGIDLLLGAEAAVGLRWPQLRLGGGRIALAALRKVLPTQRHGPGSLAMVSCDRGGAGPTAAAVASVVDAGRRAGHVVVCDVARHLDPAGAEAVGRADLVVLMVPAEVRACVAARRVLMLLHERSANVRLVVREPGPDGLVAEEVAERLEIPLLARLRSRRGVPPALERGLPNARRGSLADAATVALGALHHPKEVAPV